jgi:phosphatidylethanolamine-binding protein (PEBP) family uncharacterized protein
VTEPRTGRSLWLEPGVLVATVLLCCGSETTTSIQKLQKPPMTLTSPVFQHGGTIPNRYAHRPWSHGYPPTQEYPPSPPLEWTNAPDSTRCFALILYDADKPAGRRYGVPWLVLNLPGDTRYLPERASSHGADAGSGQGSYMGIPLANERPHRFVFALYALDAPVSCTFLPTGPVELEEAAAGHILAKAELACYTRRDRF